MEASNFVKTITEECFFIIWEALKAGENDTVMALLEGVDVKAVANSGNKTLLHLSAACGNVLITDHLVQCGCTIDAEDDIEITPLMLAIYYGHLKVTQILIDAGADLCRVNSHGTSPVFYAKLERNTTIDEIIRSAIKNNRAIKSEVMKQYMAASDFKIERVYAGYVYSKCNFLDPDFLSSYYYAFNKCIFKEVPLIKAVRLRDVYGVQMILNYHVSPNIQDEKGWTALHAAAALVPLQCDERNELSRIIEILLEHGTDVNAKHNKGATPLHVAAAYGHAAFCNELLRKGADMNARDNKGRTPLHAAFVDILEHNRIGKNKTIKLLLENKADVSAVSSKGKTVLELAESSNFAVSVKKIILKYLAVSSSLGKPMDEKDLEILRRHQEMRFYYQRCELELRLAKETRISNNATLFDLLTKSTRRLAVCVKNENFRRILESCNCPKNYPIFAQEIHRRFDKAENILHMTKDAAAILSASLPCFHPEHLALEHILSYLSYNDLQTLTK